MHDAGKIIFGILIFVAIATSPLWYNAASGRAAYSPELELPKGEKDCVESAEYMKAHHMDLLDDWRNRVVRDGEREYVSESGKTYDMSLSRTCMRCHASREKFCKKCHDYAGVATPFCWNCHVEPKDAR